MARTAAMAPVVDVLDAPMVVRTPGGDDGVQSDTAEVKVCSACSIASCHGVEARPEDHETAATFGRARFR